MTNQRNLVFNYIRVSTRSQNTERQLDKIDCDREFTDKVSGKDRNRPELEALLKFIKQGDHINVHSIDRLARNLKDLKTLVDEIINKGCSVEFHKENLLFTADKNNPFQELMFNLLGAVAEFERAIINERRIEGVAKAQEKGVVFGRKVNTDLHSKIIAEIEAGHSIRKIASIVDCSKSTIQRVKAKYDAIKAA